MSEAPITITVAGKRYGGWKTARVTRSIEALSGSFSLGVANDGKAPAIIEGDACAVNVNGGTVITGHVDKRTPAFNATDRSTGVDGRDKAADLVDCSAQLDAWEFSNVDVLKLAKKIAAPFGVSVTLQAGLVSTSIALRKKHSIDPGDSAAHWLENLCRVAGLLAISDGQGGIVLTRAGTERLSTRLVEGRNILSGSGSFDLTGRFRTYEVMGSHKGRNDLSGAQAAGVKGTATDMNARAGRVLIIRPEGSVTPAQAKKRAEWEAAVRAARGETVSVTVRGWQESAFEPCWPLNKLVHVTSPTLKVKGWTLIAGVTLSHDSAGTLTTLDLRNPKAFTPDPSIAAPGGSGGGNNYWREIVRGV